MAEKDLSKIWKKVSDMDLSGQAKLDALQAELKKEAKDTENVDWSWTIDQMERFNQIMSDLGIMRRGRCMIYLVFSVMLYNKLKSKKRTVDAVCEIVSCKYDIEPDEVKREIGRIQKDVYDNHTGVRALVDPTNTKKILEAYFGGNETTIQSTDDFIVAIANAM